MRQVKNISYRTVLFLLMVLPCTPGVAAQDKARAADASVTASAVEEQDSALPKPRIKYRNGPVCMCNTGLSEAEIAAGQRKRTTQ